MKQKATCLASRDGFGQVYDCGSCGNIHLCVGPLSLTLSPPEYLELVAMLSSSAANFEMWIEQRKALESDQETSGYGLD